MTDYTVPPTTAPTPTPEDAALPSETARDLIERMSDDWFAAGSQSAVGGCIVESRRWAGDARRDLERFIADLERRATTTSPERGERGGLVVTDAAVDVACRSIRASLQRASLDRMRAALEAALPHLVAQPAPPAAAPSADAPWPDDAAVERGVETFTDLMEKPGAYQAKSWVSKKVLSDFMRQALTAAGCPGSGGEAGETLDGFAAWLDEQQYDIADLGAPACDPDHLMAYAHMEPGQAVKEYRDAIRSAGAGRDGEEDGE